MTTSDLNVTNTCEHVSPHWQISSRFASFCWCAICILPSESSLWEKRVLPDNGPSPGRWRATSASSDLERTPSISVALQVQQYLALLKLILFLTLDRYENKFNILTSPKSVSIQICRYMYSLTLPHAHSYSIPHFPLMFSFFCNSSPFHSGCDNNSICLFKLWVLLSLFPLDTSTAPITTVCSTHYVSYLCTHSHTIIVHITFGDLSHKETKPSSRVIQAICSRAAHWIWDFKLQTL